MATNPDKNLPNGNNNDERNAKQENRPQQSATSSTDSDQNGKTMDKVDDSNQKLQADRLSVERSINEDIKPTVTVSSEPPQVSNTNPEKKNEEQKIETTPKNDESKSQPVSSTSTNDNKAEAEKLATKEPSGNSNNTTTKSNENKIQSEDDNTFTIGKGDSKYLTDFQSQKAKYFFEVNLDIENKEYVTWEDVDFYILFHLTAAGKEDSGDLEKRLTKSVRDFWDYIHSQVPLPDGKTDRLTLDQFLDTWASLTDYVVRRNQLPPIIQELVKIGFELYATDNNDGQTASIQANAFDQLFQKMNLGRTHAIIAYKVLTQNGTQPLDADKIESIVKGVITSSDEEHVSHFLLPGFFNTLANKTDGKEHKNRTPSSSSDDEQDEIQDESSSIPTYSSQKASAASNEPQISQESSSLKEEKLNSPPQFQGEPVNTTTIDNVLNKQPQTQPRQPQQPPPPPPPQQQQQQQQQSQRQQQQQQQQPQQQQPQKPQQQPLESGIPQKPTVVDEDENIRRLLRFYHIDDGDIVEVTDGPKHRVVLLHPERPLPEYIRQNPTLFNGLHRDGKNVPSSQQNGLNIQANKTNYNGKPRVTLEERLSRGDAQKGATIPIRQRPQQGGTSTIRVRQVYPNLNAAQQEEQQRQARLQSANQEKQQTEEDTSKFNREPLSASIGDSAKPEAINVDPMEEAKLVNAVLKQLTPIIEKRVAEELRRIQSGESEQDDDDEDGFIPFPFMFGPPPPFFMQPGRRSPPSQQAPKQQSEEQQTSQQQSGDAPQQSNDPREAGFGGLPPGAGFIPPPLLMAMMSDLARGGLGGDIPMFPGNMPPPPRGPGGMPGGIEGFMMFVDDDQIMGGPPGFSPRVGPRF